MDHLGHFADQAWTHACICHQLAVHSAGLGGLGWPPAEITYICSEWSPVFQQTCISCSGRVPRGKLEATFQVSACTESATILLSK